MKEQDYIDVTDLAKLRIAKDILQDCMHDETPKIKIEITKLIRELEVKTKDIILEE